MNKVIEGQVFTFGNNIDTDQIYPGRFVELTDLKDIIPHTMQGPIRPLRARLKPAILS